MLIITEKNPIFPKTPLQIWGAGPKKKKTLKIVI